ncbi:hypothetical protein J8I26_04395 [Herbaspirillum sp. LeCh32-8]|uniref:hypothetical protein n=1 Tax=Herbaspirillum sp. LeCh32-8 TaxID=2821356 RepID=UPI001AE66CA8|nr:hypothetical protein [Herbaspirillum sp. LeCh32-8]MBP0597331.1 hypothetical protein [Herbaspirillum sp. LeCh32-8]
MPTFQTQMGASQAAGNPSTRQGAANASVQSAQAGSEQAMEFQLWVAQQATSLAKLKVFSTMAKNINDQQ